LERDEEGTRSKKGPESREIETDGADGGRRTGKGTERQRETETERETERAAAVVEEGSRDQEGEGARGRGRNSVHGTTRVRTPTGQARHIQLALPRVLGQLTSSSSAAGVT